MRVFPKDETSKDIEIELSSFQISRHFWLEVTGCLFWLLTVLSKQYCEQAVYLITMQWVHILCKEAF